MLREKSEIERRKEEKENCDIIKISAEVAEINKKEVEVIKS